MGMCLLCVDRGAEGRSPFFCLNERMPAVQKCKLCSKEVDLSSDCRICSCCSRCCPNGRYGRSHQCNFLKCSGYNPGFSFMDQVVRGNETFFADNRVADTTFQTNTSKRYLGCELEASDITGSGSLELCKKLGTAIPNINAIALDHDSIIVYDGSLGASGLEFCTLPARGDAFIRQITGLCSHLNGQDVEVNSSCGYHLHIDCKDYSTQDLLNFIRLYYLVEPALFQCLPKSRRENRYCTPLEGSIKNLFIHNIEKGKRSVRSDSLTSRLAYGSELSSSMIARRKKQQKPGNRYHAINTTSWFYRGTIEVRMAAGTFNATKIVNWALFWAGFCDLVKDTYNSLAKIRSGFEEYYEQLLFEYRLSHEENQEKKLRASWEALMKLCRSDDLRTWFTERRAQFQRVNTAAIS